MITKDEIFLDTTKEFAKQVICQSAIIPQEKLWIKDPDLDELPKKVIALKTYLVEFPDGTSITFTTAEYIDDYKHIAQFLINCDADISFTTDIVFGDLITENELLSAYMKIRSIEREE